jgi:hypothetical protein
MDDNGRICGDLRAGGRRAGDAAFGRGRQCPEGRNDRKHLERYFTEREHGIVAWKSPANKSIDVMLFDTTARKAYLSRGPEYGLEWREFGFQAARND